jgi:hypothetical protein
MRLHQLLKLIAMGVVIAYCITTPTFRWCRWCAFYPDKCFSLHVSGTFGGRPPLPLSAERQLLIVSPAGSGTTATARGLSALGLEIAHESSDTLIDLARDGTVSWAHAIRFFHVAKSMREAVVARLCRRARHGAFHHIMFDGGARGGGFECATRTSPPWDSCWERECTRVVSRELGCALRAPANCTSPFRKVLLQVRHPLRTIESNVVSICEGRDDAEAARRSVLLDTYDALMPPPPSPADATHQSHRHNSAMGGGGSHNRSSSGSSSSSGTLSLRDVPGHGECVRRFGWWWVRYVRQLQPHAHAVFRLEQTTPCTILSLAGVLPPGMHSRSRPVPESAVPLKVARTAQVRCDAITSQSSTHPSAAAKSGSADHGLVNHRNGASRGSTPLRLTQRDLHAIDARLALEVSSLSRELGYELDSAPGMPLPSAGKSYAKPTRR